TSFVVTTICQAQYTSHYTLKAKPVADTLTDKKTAVKFILDSSRVFITVIDSKGNQLWKTNPWKENNMHSDRVDTPMIAWFYFKKSSWTKNKEEIWIRYNDNKFGIVYKKTGAFFWIGQD